MILLSFDTDEFDVPREHGVDFPLGAGLPEKKRGESHLLLYKQFCRKCAGGDAAYYGRRT